MRHPIKTDERNHRADGRQGVALGDMIRQATRSCRSSPTQNLIPEFRRNPMMSTAPAAKAVAKNPRDTGRAQACFAGFAASPIVGFGYEYDKPAMQV